MAYFGEFGNTVGIELVHDLSLRWVSMVFTLKFSRETMSLVLKPSANSLQDFAFSMGQNRGRGIVGF